MRITVSIRTRAQGSALVVAMTILAVASIVLGSYLYLVQFQSSSVARSQSWNTAIPISEAGIEEGLAIINNGPTWSNSLVWFGNPPVASFSNNIAITNFVLGSYTVYITNNPPPVGPDITSIAFINYTQIPWVFQSSCLTTPNSATVPPYLFATLGSSTPLATTMLARKIWVQTKQVPLFSMAMVAKTSLDLKGNNCLINSFNSSTTNYSSVVTDAPWTNVINVYDPTRAESGGDVGVGGGVKSDASIGNGTIDGHLYTGVGAPANVVQVGSNGSVGSSTNTSGIQGAGTTNSWWSPTFNMAIPDVPAPNLPGATSLPSPLTNGTFAGYISIPQPGQSNYTIVGNLTTPLLITGPAQLWVQGSAPGLVVTIAPTNNASLTMYVGTTTGSGDSLTVPSSGTLNYPGYATNLVIYGLPSLNTIDMHGNAGWAAVVDAPDANFIGGGSGSNPQDCSGSIIANNISLNGGWNFHYDESLKTNGPIGGWVAKAWQEVKYP